MIPFLAGAAVGAWAVALAAAVASIVERRRRPPVDTLPPDPDPDLTLAPVRIVDQDDNVIYEGHAVVRRWWA